MVLILAESEVKDLVDQFRQRVTDRAFAPAQVPVYELVEDLQRSEWPLDLA